MKRIVLMSLLAALSFAASAAAPAPADTVDAFHNALRAGDARGALSLMSADAVVFEQGFIEATSDAYARDSLADDMKFAAATQYDVLSRETVQSGDAAWVLSLTRAHGKVGGRAVDLAGDETMVLRRDGDAWKIVHIHWSAHPTPAGNAAAPAKK